MTAHRRRRRHRIRGYGYFKGLGPGLITGAADDDPSGIGTYSQVNPIHALFLAALFNGLAAPPILVLMVIASRSDVLGRWRSGRPSIALVAASALIMALLPAWYLLT